MALTADFEKGVNGNAVTTAAGEGSLNAWDAISGTAPVYSTTHAAHGLLAARFNLAAVPSLLQWTFAWGTQTDHYGRLYLYIATFPSGTPRLVQFANSGTACQLELRASDGRLIVTNASDTGIAATTNPLPTGQWLRIEWHVLHSTTVGQATVNVYLGDSTTLSDSITMPATQNFSTQSTNAWIGSSSTTGDFYLDDIVGAANAFPGPAVTGAPRVIAYYTERKA
jgi:hypothetical protein